jgi:hypothetical protein
MASTDELLAHLDKDPPTSVKFNDGDTFVGVYQRLEKGETAYGLCWIAVFVDDNGEERSVCLHGVLTDQLKKEQPKRVDRIAIRRLGKRKVESNDYVDWRVVSERQMGAGFDWGDVEGDDSFDSPPPF